MSVHTLVDFGPVRPSIQPYKSGYTVPVALTQVERPGIEDDTTETSWQGYLLEVPALTDLELDNAIATLPAGDYSADKQAALDQVSDLERIQTMDTNPAVFALEQRAAQQDAVIAQMAAALRELGKDVTSMPVTGEEEPKTSRKQKR